MYVPRQARARALASRVREPLGYPFLAAFASVRPAHSPRRPRGTATQHLTETLVLPTRNTTLFHVIDPRVFERALLDELCDIATRARLAAKKDAGARALKDLLPTRRAMLYFTQPSTRTFLSFNNACHILGMRTSEIRDSSTSSEVKGESFADSIRTFSSYVDVIVMRAKESGRAAQAAHLMNGIPRPVPVINAGSGSDQHPTQALLDIYTLARSFAERDGIDGKVIGMMGDLKRGRTVRSLCYLMKNYRDVRLVFIAPEQFAMQSDVKMFLDQHGIEYAETTNLPDALPTLDALYVTRMQSEWDTAGESQAVDLARFSIGTHELGLLKSDAIVMHPLPRGPEIDPAIDHDPRAMYWRQERNGMWMRVAVLMKIFGVENRIEAIESL
jgi:aspartate carbamoyltransferase catalytic subunit